MFLIIGGDAEIGSAATDRLRAQDERVAATTRRLERAAPDRPFLDLSQPLDGWEPPPGTRAACIVAAVSRLADCQRDPAGSRHINVSQTLTVCGHLIDRGIYILFLSTNQVFDGTTPDVPADAPTAPVSEYGRQKALVEAALCGHLDRAAAVGILRLARVVSPRMALIHDWVGKLRAGRPIQAFHDMTLAPVPIELVADVIAHLLRDRLRGIFQLSGPKDVSYEAAGIHVARRLRVSERLVEPTSARSAGMPEGSTPRHTTLDTTLLQMRYSLSVPDAAAVIDTALAPHLLAP